MARWSVRCHRCGSWYSGVGNTTAPYKNIKFVRYGAVYQPTCAETVSCRLRVKHKIEPYMLEIYPASYRDELEYE